MLIHLFSRFFSGPKMNVCLWMFGRLNMARTQHNSLYSQLWTELHRSSFGCIPSVRLRFDVVVVVAAHRPGCSYVFRVDLCWLKWSTCQPAMMLDNFSCVCVLRNWLKFVNICTCYLKRTAASRAWHLGRKPSSRNR